MTKLTCTTFNVRAKRPTSKIFEITVRFLYMYTEKYRAVMQNVIETFVISKKYFYYCLLLTNGDYSLRKIFILSEMLY